MSPIFIALMLGGSAHSTLVVNSSGDCVKALLAVLEYRATPQAKRGAPDSLSDWEFMVWDNASQCTVGVFATREPPSEVRDGKKFYVVDKKTNAVLGVVYSCDGERCPGATAKSQGCRI